ncbi:MAG: hypothetical protein KIT36_16590 [Alphaproteobacteria bacterium]|nr:hypothetical protein [Alphaproteobacteria bacterium]
MVAKRFLGSMAPVMGAAFLLYSPAALADAIDGDWCHTDGRRLTIHGPEIVTPGGAHMKGDYDRHGFAYVVPSPEPDAGATIVMTLLSETQMRMKSPSDPSQLWRRCGKPVS